MKSLRRIVEHPSFAFWGFVLFSPIIAMIFMVGWAWHKVFGRKKS
mgnify:CR=1 FL=1